MLGGDTGEYGNDTAEVSREMAGATGERAEPIGDLAQVSRDTPDIGGDAAGRATDADQPNQPTVAAGDDPTTPDAPTATIDKALLDRIFGVVLPETTSDERNPGESSAAGSDDWYRANRPPHHGG